MTPAGDLVSDEYDRHKAEVMRTVASKLSGSGVTVSESDLDASYNEAWHALYLALSDGQQIENRVGYLVTVTHRRALNEFRALKVSRRANVKDVELVGIELDLDARLDAEIQLRQVREGFRSRLSSRELEAATLTHLYGYSRPEAAEAMGVRPKRMEKIMDGASRKISGVVETVKSGEHCEEMSSTIRAFALGLLDPDGDRYQLASDHLDHCPACRREVWTERGLAAIGPPIPVAFALLAGGAGLGGGVAGGLALKGASAGRKFALAGGGVVTVVAVVAAVAAATGIVGDGGGSSSDSPASSLTAGDGGSAGDGGAAAASASAAQARAARNARAKARRKAKAKAAMRRQAKKAAIAAAAAATVAAEEADVPATTYVPPPEPVASEVPPEVVVPPEPEPEPRPEPEPKPEPKPEPEKPTTDAGEEFGLR